MDNQNSFESCGDSREYFGFDPTYTNDADICDNVKQLHNTRNFGFLDEFYDQGSETQPTLGNAPVYPNVGGHE